MEKFIQMTKDEMKKFRNQEHIMFTMGDDFHYSNAKQVRDSRVRGGDSNGSS